MRVMNERYYLRVVPTEDSLDNKMKYQIFVASECKEDGDFDLSLFLTSDELKRLEEQKIGDVSYSIIDCEGRTYLACERFFPFSANPEKHPHFLGKGISDLVQLFISRDLMKRFGSDAEVSHYDPSPRRELQLSRLGIKRNMSYTLLDYVSTINQNIISRSCTEI